MRIPPHILRKNRVTLTTVAELIFVVISTCITIAGDLTGMEGPRSPWRVATGDAALNSCWERTPMSTVPESSARSHVVIPARAASTRLPRKLLLRDTGHSILEHTYLAAQQARRPWGICVAAADQDIAEDVARFGGSWQPTDPDAPSGTDRVAEVARQLRETEIIVNVQGDEPEIDPAQIDQVIQLLETNPQAVISTLATPIRDKQQLEDPACVKVVFDHAGRALYFSRSPIPHVREWEDCHLHRDPPIFFQHLGIYAYRRDFLLEFSQLPKSHMEQVEKLEQLRVLDAGYSIQVGVTDHVSRGIDTLADYQAFVRRTLKC